MNCKIAGCSFNNEGGGCGFELKDMANAYFATAAQDAIKLGCKNQELKDAFKSQPPIISNDGLAIDEVSKSTEVETFAAVNQPQAIRTPDAIATEINTIKAYTRRTIQDGLVEIGRRLTEVKELVPHGQWGEWLEANVQYSKSTAYNIIKIYEEFSGNQSFEKLSYTQAVSLLGLPKEEREQFIQENDVENMSKRALEQAIKDKEAALKEKDNALTKLASAEKESEAIAKKISSLEDEKNKLKKQLDSAGSKNNNELERKTKELENLKKQIKELESRSLEVNKGASFDDIEKIKSEAAEKYEKDLALLKVEKEQAEKRIKELELKTSQQNNAAALKYSVYFDELVKNFKRLLESLSEIKDSDVETYERYKKAVSGLINKMSEHL